MHAVPGVRHDLERSVGQECRHPALPGGRHVVALPPPTSEVVAMTDSTSTSAHPPGSGVGSTSVGTGRVLRTSNRWTRLTSSSDWLASTAR
ncbi:MAG: hypothetical protein ACRYG2_02925 [Janthinobacterium lividum]